MAKLTIQIELDTQKDDLTALTKIAEALGSNATIQSKVEAIEEPVKKTKKAVKVEEVAEETKATTAEEPVAEENYTIEDVRKLFAEAKRSGADTAELRAILKEHNAAVVSDLDPKHYAAVVKKLKALQ